MITKYNLYLENIAMSNEDIVEILKSLETEDNRNAALINRLANKIDNKGKSVLMTIVQSNNEELVDYILKFNADINHTTKTGENVLFFCKSIKMFRKFYDLGVDVNVINSIKRTILTELSNKKLFNAELYQKIIDKGVDINMPDYSLYYQIVNGCSVLSNSILNKKIVELLIKNNVNLNIKEIQYVYLSKLFREIQYFDTNSSIKIFEILFKNGMKIIDTKNFAKMMVEIKRYKNNLTDSYDRDPISDFIMPLKKYITADILIDFFNEYTSHYHPNDRYVSFCKDLLNVGMYSGVYQRIKQFYGKEFYIIFADYIAEHPYFDNAIKYNL